MGVDEARRVLGVTPTASPASVRRRYHALARDLHPDAGGDPAEFTRIQQAYDVLRDREPAAAAAAMGRSSTTERIREAIHAETRPLDLGAVDWDRPLPDRPTRLDVHLLARAVAATHLAGRPLGRVTARSRGPRGVLNRAVTLLEDSLTSALDVGVSLEGDRVGVRLTTARRSTRRLLLAGNLPFGWVTERTTSDLLEAVRPVPVVGDRRTDALRAATLVGDACDAVGWPLSAWTLLVPLAADATSTGAADPPG